MIPPISIRSPTIIKMFPLNDAPLTDKVAAARAKTPIMHEITPLISTSLEIRLPMIRVTPHPPKKSPIIPKNLIDLMDTSVPGVDALSMRKMRKKKRGTCGSKSKKLQALGWKSQILIHVLSYTTVFTLILVKSGQILVKSVKIW